MAGRNRASDVVSIAQEPVIGAANISARAKPKEPVAENKVFIGRLARRQNRVSPPVPVAYAGRVRDILKARLKESADVVPCGRPVRQRPCCANKATRVNACVTVWRAA